MLSITPDKAPRGAQDNPRLPGSAGGTPGAHARLRVRVGILLAVVKNVLGYPTRDCDKYTHGFIFQTLLKEIIYGTVCLPSGGQPHDKYFKTKKLQFSCIPGPPLSMNKIELNLEVRRVNIYGTKELLCCCTGVSTALIRRSVHGPRHGIPEHQTYCSASRDTALG